MLAFYHYQKNVWKIIRNIPVSFLFVSTSKLFSGHLAFRIFKKRNVPYYLDLRDLFAENLKEYIRIPLLNSFVSNFIKYYFENPTLMNAKHINCNSIGFKSSIPVEFKGTISFYPNGIDDEFIRWKQNDSLKESPRIICYAGNIGGQGLEKIIPKIAKILEASHHFIIIGEGASKTKLEEEIVKYKLSNVELLAAMPRKQLLEYYKNAHYLFLHLNNYKSFEKVLPSKIFEYACGDIPILAGVNGYSREFISAELGDTAFVFSPCEVDELSHFLLHSNYVKRQRENFIQKYRRTSIVSDMADSIMNSMFVGHEKN
jgi:hypothetical protein